ncbi:hypothetical protein [Agrococcus jejuensis]|uniref:Uncharacterized protein n=1 Tax=Agrococcus jejuensis TaxID=399736 RepID=A0A1G8CS72_9MICO|nr:hypothetical protein [Agrococcus jejuensis]SDH47790.1 hypothetical protein SAMN04489720_1379 [Agrococcus jejuensis]
MSTHDIQNESTPEPRDERRCEHPHAGHPHGEHPHRGHGRTGFGPGHRGFGPEAAGDERDERDERTPLDDRRPFGRGMHPGRAFGRPIGHGGRGFGPRPFGPGFGPRPFGPGFGPGRPADGERMRDERADHRGARGRQRRLDRRILRTARIVAFAEHRSGREAVERTMAASVSHADHEATMRTLRTIARAVRAEHLPERGHGRRHQG